MIETIVSMLEHGANPALRYQNNRSLLNELAQVIIHYLEDEADSSVLFSQLTTLIMVCDYRLVAEYLAALKNRDKTILTVFHQMLAADDLTMINKHRYQHAHARFAGTIAIPDKVNVAYTHRLDDIFSAEDQQLVVYLRDEQYKTPLSTLIRDVGGKLGAFIEQQYDVPGLNAVVRQGLVRTWHLPNGRAVVSKRENQRKKGRFLREQSNYDALLDRLGRPALVLPNPRSPTKERISFQVAQPFAVIHDGYSGYRYALSALEDGVSLEDVLFTERDSNIRSRFLAHYRLLLDVFYEYGILWGDMSPRNVLVKKQGGTTTYVLVDFEKTTILDGPIPLAQRIEHCRGQICVEELCVLCPLEEVLVCFEGYFDPSTWDLDSQVNLPFVPRPDTADILRGRGIECVTVGEYNRIDGAIIEVRSPDANPRTKARRFPGHLGFKVEHYLSCAGGLDASEYDRKTTEVLIAAKQQKCFDQVVALLADVTNALESSFLEAEFRTILQGGFSGNIVPPQQEIENLMMILDLFYEMRQCNGAYQHLVGEFGSEQRKPKK